jgi:hypothetical protein
MGKTDAEKIVGQYSSAIDNDTVAVKATAEELQFIEIYKQLGNATAAVKQVFPKFISNDGSARNKAHALIKKFNLKGQNLKNSPYRFVRNPEADEKMTQIIKQKWAVGELDEAELFSRMHHLSTHSLSDQTRFAATKELKLWAKEAKMEVEANKLSMLDIVNLMSMALADLPREKYIDVLKKTRFKRCELIRLRNTQFDAKKERAEELLRIKLFGGQEQWQTDKAI